MSREWKELVSEEITRVMRLEATTLSEWTDRFQQDQLGDHVANAVQCMNKCLQRGGKIIVTGIGKSGKIGQKISATMTSTGTYSIFLHPTEAMHGDMGVVRAGDCILAMSQSGNTQELTTFLSSLGEADVQIVGMGGNPESKLAEVSNHWIDTRVEKEACPHNLAPTTSTTLALAIGDALAVSLMSLRGFDKQSFAKYHPAGSLGKRLQLKIRAIMHERSTVATVTPDASMDEVVLAATEKHLGGVVVLENHKLVGLITEGDIRRALQHREKFFSLKARDIMTRKPTVISPNRLASEALEIMEKRPRGQIDVLPVVENESCVGLVRLHDLLQNL